MLNKSNKGFSLIELMLAMLIGIIIIGGVMSLYISTRDTQRTAQDQMQTFADSRFAIETIGYDLRHSGVYGNNNMPTSLVCGPFNVCPSALPNAVSDCEDGWYLALDHPVVASDNNALIDGKDYSSTCATKGYKSDTDMLGVHYADPEKITDNNANNLAAGVAYARTNTLGGGLFIGSALPDYNDLTKFWPAAYSWHPVDNPDGETSNHKLVGHLYYVSNYTDVAGDNIPALRRVELESGPSMNDQVLLSGVEDMQLQFGINTKTATKAYPDTYVTADNIPLYPDDTKQWSRVRSVKIWLLMRSERKDRDNIGSAQTFEIAGNTVNTPNDGYRRQLVSGIVYLRNTLRLDEAKTPGG